MQSVPSRTTGQLSLEFKDRRLNLSFKGKTLCSDIGLALSGSGWGSQPFRECVPARSSVSGKDGFGDYEEVRLECRFEGRASDGMEARRSAAYTAGLKVRLYHAQALAAFWLLYEGEAGLSPEGGARIRLPLLNGFERGLAAWRSAPWWTHPQFVSSPRQIGSPSQHLCWQRDDGLYGLLLPLGGNGARAALSAPGGDFGCELSSFAPGFRPKETPLLVAGMGEDPYALNDRAFELASVAMEKSFLTRRSKPFPEIFEGIGWCSWNTYYYDVSQEKLLASARSFSEAAFPVKYFLIDDGWSSLRDDPARDINPDKPWPGTGRMLWDIVPDPAKFPQGLSGAIQALKKACCVAHVGVWHAFLGYWSYIHPQSPLAKRLNGALRPSPSGGLIPSPEEGIAFYELWYEYLKSEGVSFLKVDDQGSASFALKDRHPLQDGARRLEHALQAAAQPRFGNAVINCMAMAWENVSALDLGNVSRCSNDFLPTVPDNGPMHLVANTYNSFWLSRVATPDFDMFESHHPEGEAHALLRAVSGGPVYFTDKPGQEDWGLLRKLITADGRLLRADSPAQPSRDMLFSDPTEKPLALKAFCRAGSGGALAAFNVFRGGEWVAGGLKPEDIEGMQVGPCLAFEHFSGEARRLEAGQAWDFRLQPGRHVLFNLAPIDQGFAAIGLLDKFLSLKAVEGVEPREGGVTVRLREAGRFGFYSERRVKSAAFAGSPAGLVSKGPGWYEAIPEGGPKGPCELVLVLA